MTWLNWLKGSNDFVGTSKPRIKNADIKSDSEHKDAELVDLAIQHIQSKKTDKALSILTDVVSRTPKNYSNSFKEEGKLYMKFWDMSDFMSYVGWHKENGCQENVIWIGNAYPRAYYNLAWIHFENSEYETAISFLNKGLKLDPKNSKLTIEKAQALIKLGFHQEALTLFEDVISQNGFVNPLDKAKAFRGKGFIFLEEGDVNSAERFFQESFQYEPDNDIAKNELQLISTIRSCIKEAERQGINETEFHIWYPIELSTGCFSANRSQFNGDIDNSNLSSDESEYEEKGSNGNNLQEAIFKRMSQFVYYFRIFSDDRSQLGKSEEELGDRYLSYYIGYYMVLSNNHKQSNWNNEIDQIAREVGALTEEEIEAAKKDLHQAILNRIKLRLVMEASDD
jgi:tetratricopeptide (TPR) repeat protein